MPNRLLFNYTNHYSKRAADTYLKKINYLTNIFFF